jgi:hypothetical protein
MLRRSQHGSHHSSEWDVNVHISPSTTGINDTVLNCRLWDSCSKHWYPSQRSAGFSNAHTSRIEIRELAFQICQVWLSINVLGTPTPLQVWKRFSPCGLLTANVLHWLRKAMEKQHLYRLLPSTNIELIHNAGGVSINIYLILSPYSANHCVVLSLYQKRSIRAKGGSLILWYSSCWTYDSLFGQSFSLTTCQRQRRHQ